MEDGCPGGTAPAGSGGQKQMSWAFTKFFDVVIAFSFVVRLQYSPESHLWPARCKVEGVPLHNVYFVKYDVTVSFLAQVLLDTVTYFVSHVLDSGYSDIFWHIL